MTSEVSSQTIGEYLKGHRERKGWSLRDLAQRAGISNGTVSTLERGQTIPETETVLKIARALGLDELQVLRLLAVSQGGQLSQGSLDPAAAYIARRISELPPGAREKAVEALAIQLDTIYELVMGETGVRPVPAQTGGVGAEVEDEETLEDVLDGFKGMSPEQRALIEAYVAELGPDDPDLVQQVKTLGRAVLRYQGTFAPTGHDENSRGSEI